MKALAQSAGAAKAAWRSSSATPHAGTGGDEAATMSIDARRLLPPPPVRRSPERAPATPAPAPGRPTRKPAEHALHRRTAHSARVAGLSASRPRTHERDDPLDHLLRGELGRVEHDGIRRRLERRV